MNRARGLWELVLGLSMGALSLAVARAATLDAAQSAALDTTQPAPLDATQPAPLDATQPAPLDATQPAAAANPSETRPSDAPSAVPAAPAVPVPKVPTPVVVGQTLAQPKPRDEELPLREHATPVVDYTLHAVLDASAHVVHGGGTISFRNTSTAPVHELWLHLYLNAFKNERSVFLRAPVASGRGTATVSDWGYIDVKKLVAREWAVDLWPNAEPNSPGDPEDQTDIRVPLPRPLEPGESLNLDTAWDAKLPSIIERTGYAGGFHMVAQWFPKIARLEPSGQWRHFPFYHLAEFYADFGTYDVTIDVPHEMIVGATGTRVSFTAGVTGDNKSGARDVMRYVQSDVHDFAWTAWSEFREKNARAEGVDIRALYPPGYESVADREIATVAFALRYFGERYGKYPYPVLTILHVPAGATEAGGMEYPTFITCMGGWYEPAFLHGIEAVTIHEFGHQYFYGLVASDEQTFPVLDEGINSFAESDGLHQMFGAGSGFDFGGLRVGVDTVQRIYSTMAAHNEPVAQPAQAFASGNDYGNLVYARTATILDTVARVYGYDAMMRALGRYTRRYRFEHPTLDQFTDVVREVMGDEAHKNLHTALFDRGWVDYVAANAVSKTDDVAAGIFDRGGKRETVVSQGSRASTYRGYALVVRRGTLHLPVDIELIGENGQVQRTTWDGSEDWVRIPYQGESQLARVVVDPDLKILLDENLLNNSFSDAPRGLPKRMWERATYAAELLLYGLMP